MKTAMKFALFALTLLLACTLLFTACDEEKKSKDESTHVHSFGEWETVKHATCTEEGSKKRDCACGEIQTAAIAAMGHSYGEWTVTKDATCSEAGSKKRTCACGNEDVQSIEMLPHTYGEWTTTKDATCSEAGSKQRACACGNIQTEEISAWGHSPNSTNTCTRCGLTVLAMTAEQIEASKEIDEMTHSVTEYSDKIIINITLKDEKGYSKQVPVYVEITVKGENGEVLYSKTIVKKDSQSKVSVNYEEITNASTNLGTLYYKVYNDYTSFDTISKELTNIPWTVEIELPTLPTVINYTGYSASSCKVTNITYRVSSDDVYFYFTGEKTYDKNGNNYSNQCYIGWKLYDDEGFVVANGTCYTTSVKVGEKFKNEDATAYNVIEQGKTYRLEILNVS